MEEASNTLENKSDQIETDNAASIEEKEEIPKEDQDPYAKVQETLPNVVQKDWEERQFERMMEENSYKSQKQKETNPIRADESPQKYLARVIKEDLAQKVKAKEGKGAVGSDGAFRHINFDRDVFSIMKGKGHEYDWQVMELRIREVMVDMMEPQQQEVQGALKTSKNIKNDVNYLKIRLQEVNADMEQIRRMSAQFEGLIEDFVRYKDEIYQKSKEQLQMQADTLSVIRCAEDQIERQNGTIKDTHKRIEDMSALYQRSIKESQDNCKTAMDFALTTKQAVLDEFRESFELLDQTEDWFKQTTMFKNVMEQRVAKQDQSIATYKRDHHLKNLEIEQKYKRMQNWIHEKFEPQVENSQQFGQQSQRNATSIKNLDFYIDKVLPLRIQHMVNDILYQVADAPLLNRMVLSEFDAFETNVQRYSAAAAEANKENFDYTKDLPEYPVLRYALTDLAEQDRFGAKAKPEEKEYKRSQFFELSTIDLEILENPELYIKPQEDKKEETQGTPTPVEAQINKAGKNEKASKAAPGGPKPTGSILDNLKRVLENAEKTLEKLNELYDDPEYNPDAGENNVQETATSGLFHFSNFRDKFKGTNEQSLNIQNNFLLQNIQQKLEREYQHKIIANLLSNQSQDSAHNIKKAAFRLQIQYLKDKMANLKLVRYQYELKCEMEKIQKECKRYGGGGGASKSGGQGRASKSGRGGGGRSGRSAAQGPPAPDLATGKTLMKIYVDKDREGKEAMSKDQIVDLIQSSEMRAVRPQRGDEEQAEASPDSPEQIVRPQLSTQNPAKPTRSQPTTTQSMTPDPTVEQRSESPKQTKKAQESRPKSINKESECSEFGEQVEQREVQKTRKREKSALAEQVVAEVEEDEGPIEKMSDSDGRTDRTPIRHSPQKTVRMAESSWSDDVSEDLFSLGALEEEVMKRPTHEEMEDTIKFALKRFQKEQNQIYPGKWSEQLEKQFQYIQERVQGYVLASSDGLDEVPKLIQKVDNLTTSIAQDKKDLLADIRSKFDDLHEKIDNHQELLYIEHVRMARERSDLKLILKGVEKLANQLKNNTQEIYSQMIFNQSKIRQLIELEEMKLALALQDEADRYKVSLYGTSGNEADSKVPDSQRTMINTAIDRHKNGPETPISIHTVKNSHGWWEEQITLPLDGSRQHYTKDHLKQIVNINHSCCLSSSGQLPFVRKAFKIACLSYYPNKVMHRGQTYYRQELLGQIERLLSTQLVKEFKENKRVEFNKTQAAMARGQSAMSYMCTDSDDVSFHSQHKIKLNEIDLLNSGDNNSIRGQYEDLSVLNTEQTTVRDRLQSEDKPPQQPKIYQNQISPKLQKNKPEIQSMTEQNLKILTDAASMEQNKQQQQSIKLNEFLDQKINRLSKLDNEIKELQSQGKLKNRTLYPTKKERSQTQTSQIEDRSNHTQLPSLASSTLNKFNFKVDISKVQRMKCVEQQEVKFKQIQQESKTSKNSFNAYPKSFIKMAEQKLRQEQRCQTSLTRNNKRVISNTSCDIIKNHPELVLASAVHRKRNSILHSSFVATEDHKTSPRSTLEEILDCNGYNINERASPCQTTGRAKFNGLNQSLHIIAPLRPQQNLQIFGLNSSKNKNGKISQKQSPSKSKNDRNRAERDKLNKDLVNTRSKILFASSKANSNS